MNIYNLQFGYGKEIPDKISLNIYITGCKNNKKCDMKKCHNQTLRNFKEGTNYTHWFSTITEFLKENFAECICLLGGEPLDQNENEMKHFINVLKTNELFFKRSLKLFLYTGYSYEDKKELIDKLFKQGIEGICTGEYNECTNKKIWLYK